MPPIRIISNLPFSKVRTSSGCSNRFSITSIFWAIILVVAICLVPLARRQDHLLDLAQSVFAKEDLIADKEGWRSERAALDRTLGVGEEPRLDVGVLDQLAEALGIEAGLEQGGPQYRRIVELFGLRPHVPVDLVDVALEHAELLRRYGAAHDGQGVDREERVVPKARDPMALYEARRLEALVVWLVL